MRVDDVSPETNFVNISRLATAAGVALVGSVATIALAGPATAYPTGVSVTAVINITRMPPGATVTVTVSHARPGISLTIYIESAPVQLGTGSVPADSTTGSVSGQIPAGYAGNHTILGTTSDGDRFNFPIFVTSGGSGTTSGGSSGGGGLASTGAAVTGIGILGAGLVAGGMFFVVAGRRREAADSAA